EERGAVHARQQASFASDLAYLIEGATIGTAASIQDFVAENVFAELLEGALGQRALLVHLFLGLFGDGLGDFVLERIDEVVAFLLRMLFSVAGVFQPGANGLL